MLKQRGTGGETGLGRSKRREGNVNIIYTCTLNLQEPRMCRLQSSKGIAGLSVSRTAFHMQADRFD